MTSHPIPLLGRICLLLAFCLPLPALAQSSVWKVSQGDDYIYIAGTVHLLRTTDYPLPREFEQAYADSQRIYFETDIGQMNDPSLQTRLMAQMSYQDGRTLRTVLSEEAWQALDAYVQQASVPVPLPMLQTLKPGMLMSTLAVLEFQKLGFTPQGVDFYFHTRAMGDGKARGELESLDSQIALLASMGEGQESDYVLYSLKDLENVGDSIEGMISAWRAGDTDSLEQAFIAPMRESSETLYESMLVRRNEDWMPIIEGMFDVEGVEMVLAGAAHMVGEHGVLAMLQARGYQVEQIVAASP